MLIVQGEKAKCALHRGEGTKGLETWPVSLELRKAIPIPQESGCVELSTDCVAQGSQAWHLGRLRVQVKQHSIDHLQTFRC